MIFKIRMKLLQLLCRMAVFLKLFNSVSTNLPEMA